MNSSLTEKPRLGNETVKLTLAKTITLLLSTITGMILVRFRTLEEYGTYSALLIVINLFSSLFMLGLPNSINFFLARAETAEQKAHFLSVYYTLSTLLNCVIGTILVLAVPLIEKYFNNNDIGRFFYFLALYPWALATITSIDNVLVVYNRTGLLIIFKTGYSLVVLLTVLIVQWLGYDFSTFIFAFLIVSCLFSVSVYIISATLGGGLKIAIDKRLIKDILQFTIPIGLSTLVGTLSAEIDKLLIGRLMSTAQLAIYSNAAKELPLTVVAASITAVLLPRIAVMTKENRIKEAVDLWGDATVLSFIFVSVIVAGIITYAEDVVTLLYSEKYLPGVTVFRIYTLSLLVRCTYFGMILNSLGQTRKVLICSIFNLILNAILNPLFFTFMGMVGPAWATVVSMISITFVMILMTSKATNIEYSRVFPWRRMLFVLLSNIPFAIVFLLIKKAINLEQLIGSFFESLVLGGIWVICFLILHNKQIKKCWECLNQ